MNVFLVMESSGSYEDYRRCVDKVFSSLDKAEQCIADRKIYWNDIKERIIRCRKCPFCWEIENVKKQDEFSAKALNYCKDAKFDWERKNMPCHEYMWDDQFPEWDVEERELDKPQ